MSADRVKAELFPPTRWSVVFRAVKGSGAEVSKAWESLARDYWMPLYIWLRRSGETPENGADLVQGFFLSLLQRPEQMEEIDRARGRMRSWLLGSLTHYLLNVKRTTTALKRGGNSVVLSLSTTEGERELARQPDAGGSPDEAYERAWANQLLREVREKLRTGYAAKGREDFFDAVYPHLADERNETGIALAGRLGISTNALYTKRSRLRKEFGNLLRAAVQETVNAAEDVEDELRHLLRIFSS